MPPQQDDGGMSVFFGRTPNLVYPPSGWRAGQARALPLNRKLRRDYVFGYNGSCRQSLHFIGDTECVYPVASVVVVMDFVKNEQRFFDGHDNTVLCVAWNERRRLVASGQADSKGPGGPRLCIWTPDHCGQPISILKHPSDSRAISAVGLSVDGQTAVSFARDDSFMFYVWRGIARWDGLSRGPPRGAAQLPDQLVPVCSISSGRMPTGSLVMLPDAGSSEHIMFYSLGEAPAGRARGGLCGHFGLWSVTLGSGSEVTVNHKRGVFGKCAVPRCPLGVAHAGQTGSAWLVGDNGTIYTITGNSATRGKCITPSGDVQLGCIAMLSTGGWIAGGSDGALYLGVANPAPRLEERLELGKGIGGPEAAQFKSTTVPRYSNIVVRGDLVLLGTSNLALLLVDIKRRELVRVLQVSHPVAAWGIDFHPSLAILASVSEARDLRFWNVAERRPAVGKILRTELPVFSVAFRQPDGALLAVGCDRGVLQVFEFPSLQPVFEDKLSKVEERIGELRFSSDGSMLAAACGDQAIYLLRVGTVELRADMDRTPSRWEIRLYKVLTGNSSTPIALMFSRNGEYVTSNSKDGQILYWNTTSGARSKVSSAFRDEHWQAPWTLMMGWPVISVWGGREYDGSDVKSVCQAFPPDDGYLVAGDDFGRVKLMRFPNPFLNPPCQVCTGHAAFVTKVRFSCSNTLATLGGDDGAIMLWSLQEMAEDIPRVGRLVHPWSQLDENAGDDYGFLGAPALAEPPRPPRAHFEQGAPSMHELPRSWSGGPPAGAPVRAGLARAASGLRAPAPAEAQGPRDDSRHRAAGERTPSREPRQSTPGGRGRSSNESGGVGAALRWD